MTIEIIAETGEFRLVRDGERWGTMHEGVTWPGGDPVEWHASELYARRAYAQDRGLCEVCGEGVAMFGEWRCEGHPESEP